jgi:chromate transporter
VTHDAGVREDATGSPAAEEVSLGRIARTFLRLGAVGFGGPAAHIALLQEELVERRRWIDRERFLEALGVSSLVPGPTSSELAIHTGYLLGGQPGALVAGISFVLPAFVVMTGLSAAYVAAGGFEVRDDLVAGIQPVVIAVIVAAVWRLRSAVAGWLATALAGAVAVLTVSLPAWEPLWLLGAGLTVASAGTSARRRLAREERGVVGEVAAGGTAGLVLAAAAGVAVVGAIPALAWVFLKTGALLFGGGYVLLPLLEPEVLARGWLTRGEFLDGIALGQATPGPIVTTSAFVGYVVSGVAGAAVATVAIYLPSFVVVMAGTGPFLRSFRRRPAVRDFLRGANAAAVGAIAGAGILLGRTALGSPLRLAVGLAATVALLARVPVWAVLLAGGAVGLAAGAFG